ncbi:unnamed protein product [Musa hybrid cultivar]
MSFVLWSLICAVVPLDPNLVTVLVVARLLVGVAQGFIFPSIHTVLAQWVPPFERSRSVSLTTSGMYLGAASGMLLLPSLVKYKGPQSVFLAEAALGAIWTFLWFKFASDAPRSDHSKATSAGFGHVSLPITKSEDNKVGLQKTIMQNGSVHVAKIPWKSITFSLPIWAIVVNSFTFHYALYVLMNWLPTYFELGLKQSLQEMGSSKMLPYLNMFIFSNIGGTAADYLITRRILSVTKTRKFLNTLGFLVASVALMVLPSFRSSTGAVFCSSIALGSLALGRAGFAVNHMDVAPKYAGIVMGISNTAGTLAGVVGVGVTGRILDAAKNANVDLSSSESWKPVFFLPGCFCIEFSSALTMEDQKGAAVRASSSSSSSAAAVAAPAPPPPLPALAPPPPAPPQSSSSSDVAAAAAAPKEEPLPPADGGQRVRFSVELKPGETTIVSWKRLLKESNKGGGSLPIASVAERPLAVQVGTGGPPAENELKDAVPPPNRFSAVIEKIERLYMGKQSSDEEELDDIPDDDQYDTEDSFIDDAELDEYFQVDKMSTKHNGYFVNKGKLEQIEPSSLPKEAPKRRRRRDSTKLHGDGSHVLVPGGPAKVGSMRIKDAARNAPVMGRKPSPAKVYAPYGEHYSEEGRSLKYKSKTTTTVYKRKSADFTIKSEEQSTMRVPNKDVLPLPLELKDFDKHKSGVLASEDTTHRASVSHSFDPLYQASRSKVQVEFQPKKLLKSETGEVSAKIRRKEKYGSSNFPAMNSSMSVYPMHAAQPSTRVKESSSMRPKGTTLERAIRDLEKIVAECRPPSLDVHEVDPAFQGIKRRLPQEVKQKLAKVARLSASQGKISEDELIDRLMGILGHLVQRKTLKKNMREMVELGLSAKQQKADRFQQIKREVNEMIRARVSQLKSKLAEKQDGSADDFQEINNDERSLLKGRYSMDAALEDKICDLYDLYVEGMDEDKGPQSRKLYVELAELWPSGYMDNVGIKDAIYRSKERKRSLYRQHKVHDEERIKRKKLASTKRTDETNPASQLRAGQEKPVPVVDATARFLAPLDKLISNQPAGSTGRSMDSVQPADSSQHTLKNPDKVRVANMSTNPEDASKAFVDVKKKLKRKAESELSDTHIHSQKVPSQHITEKQKSPRIMDETNMSYQPKPSLELPGPTGSDQQS